VEFSDWVLPKPSRQGSARQHLRVYCVQLWLHLTNFLRAIKEKYEILIYTARTPEDAAAVAMLLAMEMVTGEMVTGEMDCQEKAARAVEWKNKLFGSCIYVQTTNADDWNDQSRRVSRMYPPVVGQWL
jgi:hypothetical protein